MFSPPLDPPLLPFNFVQKGVSSIGSTSFCPLLFINGRLSLFYVRAFLSDSNPDNIVCAQEPNKSINQGLTRKLDRGKQRKGYPLIRGFD